MSRAATAIDPAGQPPAKRARADAPRVRLRPDPTWSDLPHDIICTISTFLAVGIDLQNILVVVGREHAGLIKKAYLKLNFRFLWSSIKRGDALKRQYHVRQWMEVNDWRAMYDRRFMFECGAMSNGFGEHYEVAVPTTPKGLMMNVGPMGQEVVFLGYRRFQDGKKGPCEEENLIHRTGDVLISVDGQSTANKPFKEVLQMLKESAKKDFASLRFVERSIDVECFSNPAVAIDLGLVEVLRFLVEEKSVDVNYQSRRSLLDHRRLPLLAVAMAHPDPSMFEYLLTVGGIDCSCELQHWRKGTEPKLLHYASCRKHIEASRLKTLIEHQGVDTNARNELGSNALHFVATGCLDENAVAKVRILLEAGVDPNARTLNSHRTPLDRARRQREKEKSMRQDEVIALLESATNPNV